MFDHDSVFMMKSGNEFDAFGESNNCYSLGFDEFSNLDIGKYDYPLFVNDFIKYVTAGIFAPVDKIMESVRPDNVNKDCKFSFNI